MILNAKKQRELVHIWVVAAQEALLPVSMAYAFVLKIISLQMERPVFPAKKILITVKS